MVKKLIEVALPLEKINTESAREKSIRHGHPSTLHLWWARRPLAAARAVIWSSLVDDPSSHPEQFPTEEEQKRERQRLFKILEDLVVWENSNNQKVLSAAKAEIIKSTNGNPPAFLDPFSGGGAIPLEAQRLGLETHAHDLNPVAVAINKAMIEIPPRFSAKTPINPDDAISCLKSTWEGAQGLAADIQYYGKWMKNEAINRIGYLYPRVTIPYELGGGEATVIAWIWARTVKCPNPLCDCRIPLANSYILSKKKGKEAWIKPIFENNSMRFEVQHGKCPSEYETNKQGRSALFKCPVCGAITTDAYVKKEGQAHRLERQMMAVVAEGKNGRIYLSPDQEQLKAAQVPMPEEYPSGPMPNNPRWFSPPAFGMTEYSDLFTSRQMIALTTYCDLVIEAQKKAESDAIKAGYLNDHIPLFKGGTGAMAYGQAVGVYLAFGVDKLTNYSCSLCTWLNQPKNEIVGNAFGRQALPMVWDFAEANIFSNGGGTLQQQLDYICKVLSTCIPYAAVTGHAEQFDAQSDCKMQDLAISTDPPYYDNIGYADLSDFFYIWLRKSLTETYPSLFQTVLTPKEEELIATPYRHGGNSDKAKAFFEAGMLSTCKRLYGYARNDIPVTIYYAYKQSDTEEGGTSSSGWETMLTAIIKSGFSITGTWPVRTERDGRMISNGTNALASSIVLVCRKRPEDAPQTTRRNLINILRRELRPALKRLQDSNIAPVDLAQSAIGPGMGVFSRYSRVLEADGTPMSVRSALQVINEEIDLYFNEQVGDLDAMSRFCVDLYTQNAFNDIKFGDADILARAKGTSVAALSSHDVVYAKAGNVHLIERTELPDKIDANESCIWMLTQQLTQAMATGGVEACAKAVFMMFGSNAERAKDLAYRLYTIAEQKKWSTEAFAYNALVVAWPDIQSRAAMMQRETPEQMDMFSMGLLDQ